jgi:hypothetical protein
MILFALGFETNNVALKSLGGMVSQEHAAESDLVASSLVVGMQSCGCTLWRARPLIRPESREQTRRGYACFQTAPITKAYHFFAQVLNE